MCSNSSLARSCSTCVHWKPRTPRERADSRYPRICLAPLASSYRVEGPAVRMAPTDGTTCLCWQSASEALASELARVREQITRVAQVVLALKPVWLEHETYNPHTLMAKREVEAFGDTWATYQVHLQRLRDLLLREAALEVKIEGNNG
jgi:hypothetical protein